MAENVTAYNVKIVMSAVGAKKTADDVKKIKDAIKGMGDTAKKLWGSLKRIAMYRLLRTAIKGVTSSVQEGIANLKEWSRLNDGRFYASMQRLSSAVLTIKNSLAVALAPVIENVIVPLVEKVANAFVVLSNQISMFAARLKGETKYLGVATSAMNKYAAAQRSILGFDELNKLNGGNSDTDYNGMFAYYDMPESSFGISAADLVTNAKLKLNITEVEPELLIGGAVIGALIIGALKKALTSGIVTAAGGASAAGAAGAAGSILPLLATAGLMLVISSVAPQISDEVHDSTVLEQLASVLDIGLGALIGFAVGGPGGAVLGATVGLGLSMLINNSVLSDKFGFTERKVADMLEKALQLTGMAGITLLASGHLVGGAVAMGLTVGLAVSWIVKEAKLSDQLSANVLSGIGTIAETTGPISVNTANKESWNNPDVSVTGTIKPVATKYDPKTGKVSLYANGGYPSSGSMFIAGEAGPELVANIGGRTGVYNSDQLGGALSGANEMIVEALYQVAGTITNAIANQPTPSIKIGDREIYQASQRGSRVIGSSLVQGV